MASGNMAPDNMIGTINSVQGEALVIRESGERILAHEGGPVFEGDVVVASGDASVFVNVGQADTPSIVSINANEMAQINSQMIQNTSALLSGEPLNIGTPMGENVIPLFHDAVAFKESEYIFQDNLSVTDEVMVITPFASTNDATIGEAETFVWNENYEAQPYLTLTGTMLATDSGLGDAAKESITLQLAEITGMGSDVSDSILDNVSASDGVLKLSDFLQGSVTNAMEAANYVHLVSDTSSNSGISGLYISKDGALTDESREMINALFANKVVAGQEPHLVAEKSIADITGFTDSGSQQGVADQLQALMDMGFLEI